MNWHTRSEYTNVWAPDLCPRFSRHSSSSISTWTTLKMPSTWLSKKDSSWHRVKGKKITDNFRCPQNTQWKPVLPFFQVFPLDQADLEHHGGPISKHRNLFILWNSWSINWITPREMVLEIYNFLALRQLF